MKDCDDYDDAHLVLSWRRGQAPPPRFGFAGHVHFVDFEDFGRRNPVWVAQVREPVRKFISK